MRTDVADRRALIVANDVYNHDGLRGLVSPTHDAEALERVLSHPQIGRFDVTVVHNQPAHVMRLEVENFFADRHRDDLLVMHFSGHGLKDAAGGLYLAASDTRPSRLGATAVSAQFLNRQMADSRARRTVLFLDCCYSGAFARGMDARADDVINVADSFPVTGPDRVRADEGRGRVVITASSATEYAFEDGRLASPGTRRPSVFTSALVQGLETGEADIDRDGLVDLNELYDYIYDRVRTTTAGQTPSRSLRSQEGKVVIAWTAPVARIQAADIPADLAIRAQNESRDVRLAVVRDLRRILLDDDRARAAGALDALQRLSDDDSGAVAAAATAAVDESQLKAVPNRIDLDLLAAGRAATVVTVRLVGSPLAQTFRASTTTRGLTLEQSESPDRSDGWVRISIDENSLPPGRGNRQGTITVVNRIGEFEIPVIARTSEHPWMSTDALHHLPAISWANNSTVLSLSGIGVVAATLTTLTPIIHKSGLLGIGYFLIRFALLFAGLRLLTRSGAQRAAGLGVLAASVSYFVTDAVINVHSSATPGAWLEFLAVFVFVGLLVLRMWPFPAVPRRLRLVPPAGDPFRYIVLASATAQFLLLFVGIPDDTLADSVGIPGAILAVVPMAGLCVTAVLAASIDDQQRTFVTTAAVAYFVPELYFMLGSLLLGAHFSYLGDDLWSWDTSHVWFVTAQAAATAALATSTLLALHRAGPGRPKG